MILEEGIVGLDNWPSRFKCPLGFTQLRGHTRGELGQAGSDSPAANVHNISKDLLVFLGRRTKKA